MYISLHASITDGGFIDGIMHPISGIDHLLAMLSVGIVSNMLSKKHLYLLPLAFVSSMAIGGLLGYEQITVYFTEMAISLSVIILGAMTLITKKTTSPLPIYLFTIVFGIAHGYAHGIEMPYASHASNYVLGFSLATSIVHIIGICISKITEDILEGKIVKIMGLISSMIGVYLLIMQI
ncbi:MAG: hypothetical protein RLZZ546_2520 [Bacteroidota bacterium]